MSPKNAWIYCRIDAPEDTHGTLKNQYEQLARYAEQMDFHLVGSSQDFGENPSMGSTGIAAALEAAKAGAFSILLVTDFTRVGRSSACVGPILAALRGYGIALYSPLEGRVDAGRGAVS